jgi:CBS domain-containing protein
MRERGAYEVFVVDRDKIGAVIARDLLAATHIATRKASTLVLKMPRLSPNSTIGEAARLMVNYRIRALPVVADDKLVGEVNAIAILRAMREVNLGETQKVSSIMTSAPITIRANDNAAKARELMVRRKIDHLPVVGDGKLIGIVTSNDLINRMIPPEGVGAESMVHKATRRLDYGVKDMMDSVPLTVRPSDPLPKVLNDILSQRKTYAVVILFDEIQGIVTHRDYMKLVAAPEEKPSIPTFIVGLPEDPFEAETAKIKFTKTVQQLGRVFPDIVEARSVIKTKSTRPEKERRRYEVKVTLATPRESYSFSEVGWELPAIYDELVDKMKRLMTKKVPARKPERRRVAASP